MTRLTSFDSAVDEEPENDTEKSKEVVLVIIIIVIICIVIAVSVTLLVHKLAPATTVAQKAPDTETK